MSSKVPKQELLVSFSAFSFLSFSIKAPYNVDRRSRYLFEPRVFLFICNGRERLYIWVHLRPRQTSLPDWNFMEGCFNWTMENDCVSRCEDAAERSLIHSRNLHQFYAAWHFYHLFSMASCGKIRRECISLRKHQVTYFPIKIRLILLFVSTEKEKGLWGFCLKADESPNFYQCSSLVLLREKWGSNVFFTLAQVMIIHIGFPPPLSHHVSFCFQYEHMEQTIRRQLRITGPSGQQLCCVNISFLMQLISPWFTCPCHLLLKIPVTQQQTFHPGAAYNLIWSKSEWISSFLWFMAHGAYGL